MPSKLQTRMFDQVEAKLLGFLAYVAYGLFRCESVTTSVSEYRSEVFERLR
jgi:hypothetical protein